MQQPLSQVPSLLIITGAAGHGKDTIADFLIGNYGYSRLSISDHIRREITPAYAKAPFPVTEDWQNERQVKNSPQVRMALRFCSDEKFVAIALQATEQEDQVLFNRLSTSEYQPAALFVRAARRGHWTREERLALPREPRRIQQIWGTEYRRVNDDDYWLKKMEPDMAQPGFKVMSSGRYQNEVDFVYAHGGSRWHVVRPGHSEATVAHPTETNIAPIDEHTLVIQNDGSPSELGAKVGGIITLLRTRAPELDDNLMADSRPRARLAI